MNSNLFCPKLSNGLNFLRLNSDLTNYNENLQIQNVKILGSWIKYGKVKNQTKLFGIYDTSDFIHELLLVLLVLNINQYGTNKQLNKKFGY